MVAGHALVMWVGEGVVAVVVRLRCNKSAGGPQTCCGRAADLLHRFCCRDKIYAATAQHQKRNRFL